MHARNFRVSVIITSYNQKNYLREAIESVLTQTVPCCEIIIVDDCSSDGSPELIMEYADRYSDLIRAFCHPQNLGIPKNRNSALERAQGDYVAILDGDDRFLPFKVERQLQALKETPEAQVVYSNFYLIDQSGKRMRVRYKAPQPSGNIFKDVFSGKYGLLRSALINYTALKEVGFMDPHYWNYDGFELMIKLSKKYRFTYIQEPLLEKRVLRESFQHLIDPTIALEELQGIYEKNAYMLDDIPPKDAQLIRKQYFAMIARFEALTALKKGQRGSAFKKYMSYLAKNPAELIKYKSHLRFLRGGE